MNISSGQPSVSICCEENETIERPEARCSWNVSFSTKETIFPKVFDLFWSMRNDLLAMIPGSKIPCPNNTVCYSDCQSENNISTYLFENGTASMNDSINGGLICSLDATDYCFETNVTYGMKDVISVCKTYFDFLANLQLARENAATRISYSIYPIFISLLFFALTFLIYTILPELKNLHGLILRTYITCCFGHFLMRLIMFANVNIGCHPFIMISMNFVFLTTFFWLNIMSFDIWWTFRSLTNPSKRSPGQKYIIYSIYAWGMPMLIIAAGLFIVHLPNVPNGVSKRGLHKNCWGQGFAPRAAYYEIPMTFTVACNVCFFVLTAINIAKQKKATAECLEGNDSRQYNDERNRFNIYLKLSIVMGLVWLDDVRMFIVKFPLPPYALFIVHFPHNIYGVIVFVVSVWNDKTKRMLSKRFGLKDWTSTQWIEHSSGRIRRLVRRPEVS